MNKIINPLFVIAVILLTGCYQNRTSFIQIALEDTLYKTMQRMIIDGNDTIPEGPIEIWNKNPYYLLMYGEFRNGKKEGPVYFYNSKGDLILSYNYINDKLQDTSFKYSFNQIVDSYKVYNQDTLLIESYKDDQQNDFLTFRYNQNNTIDNLFQTYTDTYNFTDKLIITDSTYIFHQSNLVYSGTCQFHYPYTILLDSVRFFIKRLSIKTIEIETYQEHPFLPKKWSGYVNES